MANNKFRFLAQRVLPLVYDDSLSYYEILCKIVAKINEITEVWDPDKINEILTEALDEYLDNLDIYDEVMQNLDLYFADVLDYAADNTGTTDSTTAFSNAIASGKGVIVVPPGQYIVNNLVIPSHKTILGYGAELIANDPANGKPNILRNNNTIQDVGYNGDSNIRIEGLSFSAPSLNTCTLLAFGHCNNVHVINCRFHHWNGWHGIEFCGASNCIVENCTFDNYGSTTGVYSECLQLDYMHQESTFPWFGPYNDCDCQNIKIINNSFLGLTAIRDNAVSPYNYLYAAIGSHTPRANFIRNILIDGNYIENFYQALSFYDLYDSVISNNIVKGCYIGFMLSHYIVRNEIFGNQLTGIATAANHPDGWRGIAVYRPDSSRVVRDNDIHDNHIFDYTYGITYQGINSNIHNNYVTRGVMAGIMCGLKESSNQYMFNKLTSTNGDDTHKTLTVVINDGDDVVNSGGLLIANNIVDYCYIDTPVSSGGWSYVRDNQINGGITYGPHGNEHLLVFRNLVGTKYNDGLRTVQSSGAITLEPGTWTDLTSLTLNRGGVYMILVTGTTTTPNDTFTVQAYVPGNNVTQTIDTGTGTAGRSVTASLLHATPFSDATLTARVWSRTEANLANWRVQVVDLAVSPRLA